MTESQIHEFTALTAALKVAAKAKENTLLGAIAKRMKELIPDPTTTT